MRKFKVVILPIVLLIYLYLSYTHTFFAIGQGHLPNPNMWEFYTVKATNESQQPVKYLALGDSLTAGVGVESFEESLPYLLADKMKEIYGSVTIINLGQPGAKTSDVLKSQLPKALQEKPAVITLLVGVNDVINFNKATEFEQNYRAILDQLTKNTQARIIVINLPFLGTNQVLYPPYNFIYDARTNQFNEIINRLAEERSLKYVDIYTKTKEQFSQKPNFYYSRDQFHPSSEGYKFWGKIIDVY